MPGDHHRHYLLRETYVQAAEEKYAERNLSLKVPHQVCFFCDHLLVLVLGKEMTSHLFYGCYSGSSTPASQSKLKWSEIESIAT